VLESGLAEHLSVEQIATAAAELGEPPPPEQDASIVALEQITGLSGGALFALMLVAAFVGGVILNAMPCVLPVLTLKLYGLVSHAEAGAAYNRRAGLAYTLGILVSFWALALAVVILKVAFSTSAGWGFQMQSPVFVAVLATIVFGFSLSLFGVFEIPAMGTDAASRATQRGGLAGDFLYGAFATLLSTPCSAPFLGPAVGFALSQSIPSIFLFFSLIGLGLAAPYLAVAFVPALFRLMPKPGAWMETFKQLMGFTLVATTLWLVSFLPKQVGIDSTIGFLAFLGTISLGLWIFGHWGGLEHTWRRQLVALGVGVVVAVGGGWLFLALSLAEDEPVQQGLVTEGLDFEEEIPWQPFSDENVAALAGRTVFIDFTADWCLTCKVNELTVLETRTVREAMAAHEVVPLKADWTRRDPVIGEWLKRYGRAGVPFYLVIPAEAGAETIPLSEVITPDMVVDALERGS